MKEYSIILTKFDIEMLLGRKIDEEFHHTSKESMIKAAKNIIHMVYLEQNNIYKLLKINYQDKAYQNTFD